MPATWTPTVTLRWFKPTRLGSELILQQLWIRDGHESQWRNVNVVCELADI